MILLEFIVSRISLYVPNILLKMCRRRENERQESERMRACACVPLYFLSFFQQPKMRCSFVWLRFGSVFGASEYFDLNARIFVNPSRCERLNRDKSHWGMSSGRVNRITMLIFHIIYHMMAFTMRSLPPPTTICQSLQKMTLDRLEYDFGVHSEILRQTSCMINISFRVWVLSFD